MSRASTHAVEFFSKFVLFRWYLVMLLMRHDLSLTLSLIGQIDKRTEQPTSRDAYLFMVAHFTPLTVSFGVGIAFGIAAFKDLLKYCYKFN